MDYHSMQDDNPDTLQIPMAVDTTPGTVVMVMRLATAIKKRSTEELMGIKLRQLMLLSYLRHGAPALQQQLCEALWLDANNCVLLLNELEDMGYAERAQESIGDQLFAALSEDERATLRSLLGRALEPAHA